jgi:hypothetical protein
MAMVRPLAATDTASSLPVVHQYDARLPQRWPGIASRGCGEWPTENHVANAMQQHHRQRADCHPMQHSHGSNGVKAHSGLGKGIPRAGGAV